MRSRWKLSIRSLQRESAEPIAISHVFQTPQDDVVKLKYFMLSSPTKIERLKVLAGLTVTLSLFLLLSYWPKRYWGWRRWMEGENGFEPRLNSCPSALQWRGNNQRVHKLWLINIWVKCISSNADTRTSRVWVTQTDPSQQNRWSPCLLPVCSLTHRKHSRLCRVLFKNTCLAVWLCLLVHTGKKWGGVTWLRGFEPHPTLRPCSHRSSTQTKHQPFTSFTCAQPVHAA